MVGASQDRLAVDREGELLVLSQPKLADPKNPLTGPAQALAAALARADRPTEAESKTLLSNLRGAQSKLEETLVEDQNALRKIATIRQEAILVSLGFLE